MDFNALTDDQLRKYLTRRNVDHIAVVERSELLDLAQNQAAHRESTEKKLVDELLDSFQTETNVQTRVEKLQAMMRRVQTKPAKRDLKKALGFHCTQWATTMMFELDKRFGDREITPEMNDELKTAETVYSIAIFYNKKNPEALGGRGLCRVRRGQIGAALKDIATAVTFKDDPGCWHDIRLSELYENALQEQKALYKFGRWQKLALDPSPAGRFFPAYCHDNAGKMYVYGGECAVPNEWHGPELSDLWELDTTREPMSWTRVPFSADSDRLPPLKKAGMCHCKGVLYIFGGESEGQESNRLYSIHLGTRRCKRIKTSGLEPGRRKNLALFERKGALTMYGGGDKEAHDADVWHCNLTKRKWSRQHTKVGAREGSRGSESNSCKPPFLQEFSWWFDAARDMLLVWGKAGSLGMPWAGGERVVAARWQCDLATGEWVQAPFRGYSVPPFLERACCSSASAGGQGGGAHWGFGGYSDIWYHDAVRADADGVARPDTQQCAYYNDIVMGDDADRWHFVVPVGLGEEPTRCGGCSVTPLVDGSGFVMFGGYHTYDDAQFDFSYPKHLADTWVFRRCNDDTSELVMPPSPTTSSDLERAMAATLLKDQPGAAAVPPAAAAASRGGEREARQGAAEANAGMKQMNLTLYMEAVRQLAKTAEWRLRLSQQSLAGAEMHGAGVLVVKISLPPLPCHELLAAARFVPGPQVAAEMNSAEDRADAAETVAALAPRREFILAILPGPAFGEAVRLKVPVRFYSFGNAPGVGEMGPNVVYAERPETAAQQLTPEVQRVLDAQTSDATWEAAAVQRGAGSERPMPQFDKCNAPGCPKVRVLNAFMFPGMAARPDGTTIVATLSKCKCQQASYCSKQCQLADWKQHKKACKQAMASAGAAAGTQRRQWNDSLLAAAGSSV